MISVIIPARNEKYIRNTLDSLYANAGADFETIVVMDGPTTYSFFRNYPNLIVVENTQQNGVRNAIRQGVSVSSGDLLLKLDAHCTICPNFISILKNDIMENWVVVARRFTLDLETMVVQSRPVDYYYLSCPWTHPSHFMMQSCPWITRTEECMNNMLDDLMCFQGSMWMMSRKHWDNLGGLEIGQETYAEHHEISMKTWSSGGRVVINKNAWYAHPSRGSRGYRMDMDQVYKDHDHSARYWTNQAAFFEWLIAKFWPLPTEHNRHRLEKYYWPENWEGYVRSM